IGREFLRGSGRLSVQHNALRNLFTLGANLSMNYIENENNGSQFGTAQSRALPIYPVFAPDGTGYFNNGFVSLNQAPGTNTVFTRINTENATRTFRNNAVAFVEAKPLKGLSIRSEWGYDLQNNNDGELLKPDIWPATAKNNPGAARGGGNGQTSTRRFYSLAWNTNNTITYDRVFSTDHRVTLLAGASLLNQRNSGRTYVFDGIPILSLDLAGTQFAVQSTSESLFRFASIFSRINYSYKDKYLLEGSIRQDGSSRFGPGNRVGTFGGGSLGWIVSEEDFFRNNVSFLNFLKLRVSYGTIGNAELPSDFSYISLAASTDSESSHGGFSGLSFNAIGNRNLKWESTTEANLGLDMEAFKGRIRLSVDFYNKESRDLLLGAQLANSTGYLDRNYNFNVGSLRNRGFEIELNTRNIDKGSFVWTSNFNISRNTAKVLELQPIAQGSTRISAVDGGSNRLVEGGTFGAYFLPIYAGIDTKTGTELIYEVDQPYLSQTGIARLTGNVLDAAQSQNLNNHRMLIEDKTPLPDFYGGLTNTFSYKGIELSALFYFQYGNYILDEGERNQSYPSEQQSLRADMKNALTDNTIPLVYASPLAGVNTTRFLRDGSFIRLRNLQLGYNFPSKLSTRYGIKNMRIYVAAQNLLTFTKFPGWDPEVFTTGGADQRANIGPGITSYNLPQVRTLLAGININF
ncbi:MAG: SusC/RagA family TonB-linked outer membrane protein, partial [Chitinophagaceae bacterium]|nr:SusC/RagA family TonB-linked outer membrane protein [Chitinophagaceae bacterium]